MERATQPPPPPAAAEEQNQEEEQLQNLAYLKTQTQSLQKSISRVLEYFNAYRQTNTPPPKWKDVLGQYRMISLDLFILMEEIKQVSKDLVVLPKNVNAENASILPVMLSTKLLPEMEADNKVKKDQLLQEVQSLPIPMQIETLKERIGKIAEACGSAEKVMADARKAYGFAPHSGLSMLPVPPTIDKAQAAKILEQDILLRGALNDGTGLRLPPDQREITTALPPHMVDALFDPGNNALPVASDNINSQGNLMQVSGTQVMESSVASSSGANFDATRSPLPYSDSPNSQQSSMQGMSQQYGVSGTNPQRSHASQLLGDQVFNSSGMVQTQQSPSQQPQQEQQQGGGGSEKDED